MYNDWIPNISRHFLYSILESNQISGIKIIESIEELSSEEVGEFLYSLGNNLAGYFFRLEAGLEGYDEMRIQELKNLKNHDHEENMEEFN